jgi:hypothetical protein
MNVVPLRSQSAAPLPFDFTPAIRTPDQFQAAHDRVDEILVNLAAGDLTDPQGALNEAQNLRRALDSSPFCMLGRQVTPRGFSARLLARVG